MLSRTNSSTTSGAYSTRGFHNLHEDLYQMVEISKVILVVSFIFTFTCSFGQQLINGRIIDENSKPMPYANVILINQVDSTFILGTVTNTDGTFSMQTMRPNGLLKISYLGYETKYVNFNNSSIGEIKMEPTLWLLKMSLLKVDKIHCQ